MKRSVHIQSSMLCLGSDDRQIHFRNYIPRTSGTLRNLKRKYWNLKWSPAVSSVAERFLVVFHHFIPVVSVENTTSVAIGCVLQFFKGRTCGIFALRGAVHRCMCRSKFTICECQDHEEIFQFRHWCPCRRISSADIEVGGVEADSCWHVWRPDYPTFLTSQNSKLQYFTSRSFWYVMCFFCSVSIAPANHLHSKTAMPPLENTNSLNERLKDIASLPIWGWFLGKSYMDGIWSIQGFCSEAEIDKEIQEAIAAAEVGWIDGRLHFQKF